MRGGGGGDGRGGMTRGGVRARWTAAGVSAWALEGGGRDAAPCRPLWVCHAWPSGSPMVMVGVAAAVAAASAGRGWRCWPLATSPRRRRGWGLAVVCARREMGGGTADAPEDAGHVVVRFPPQLPVEVDGRVAAWEDRGTQGGAHAAVSVQ